MELTVNGHRTYCYTGGKPFDPAQPTLGMFPGVRNAPLALILSNPWLAQH